MYDAAVGWKSMPTNSIRCDQTPNAFGVLSINDAESDIRQCRLNEVAKLHSNLQTIGTGHRDRELVLLAVLELYHKAPSAFGRRS